MSIKRCSASPLWMKGRPWNQDITGFPRDRPSCTTLRFNTYTYTFEMRNVALSHRQCLTVSFVEQRGHSKSSTSPMISPSCAMIDSRRSWRLDFVVRGGGNPSTIAHTLQTQMSRYECWLCWSAASSICSCDGEPTKTLRLDLAQRPCLVARHPLARPRRQRRTVFRKQQIHEISALVVVLAGYWCWKWHPRSSTLPPRSQLHHELLILSLLPRWVFSGEYLSHLLQLQGSHGRFISLVLIWTMYVTSMLHFCPLNLWTLYYNQRDHVFSFFVRNLFISHQFVLAADCFLLKRYVHSKNLFHKYIDSEQGAEHSEAVILLLIPRAMKAFSFFSTKE